MMSCIICISLFDFYHLAQCPSRPSVLLQVAKLAFLLWLSVIPVCVCVRVCVCVCVRVFKIFTMCSVRIK